jgi:predicted SpoU family rRNA methylase
MNTLSGTSKKQIVLAVVLADFVALNVYAVAQYGIVGIFERCLANAATILAFADLTIALSLVMVWMWQDARRHDISPIPYVALTLGFGSVGPLLYLIRRFGRDEVIAPHSVLTARPQPARA